MKCFLIFLCLSGKPTKYIPQTGTDLFFQTQSYSRSYIESRVRVWAKHFKIPVAVVKGVISQESGWNVLAESSVGAKGLMQLMAGTASDMGMGEEESLFNPDTNIYYGCKYLRFLLDKFHKPETAFMAYYAGPGIADRTYVHRVRLDSAEYSYSVLNKSLAYIGSIDAVF